MNTNWKYRIGEKVMYSDRVYTVLSVTRIGLGGPHYRLGACGEYPGEDLTAESLLRPATADVK